MLKDKKSSIRGHQSSMTRSSNSLTIERRALCLDLFPAFSVPKCGLILAPQIDSMVNSQQHCHVGGTWLWHSKPLVSSCIPSSVLPCLEYEAQMSSSDFRKVWGIQSFHLRWILRKRLFSTWFSTFLPSQL